MKTRRHRLPRRQTRRHPCVRASRRLLRGIACALVFLFAPLPDLVLAQSPGAGEPRRTGAAAPAPPNTDPRTLPSATPGSIPEYHPPAPAEAPSMGWEAIRTVLALGAVFLLLAVGVRVARRWHGLGGGAGAGGHLQVLARVALSPKEAICLVRAGAEILVVGVSGGGLTLLSRLDPAHADRPSGGTGSLPFPLSPQAAWEGSGARRPGAARLQALAQRVRDVQAAWGIRDARGEGR